MQMTSHQRVARTLARLPVDTVPVAISPWDDTVKKWVSRGHIREGEDLVEHFDLDIRTDGAIDGVANVDYGPIILEETEETILRRDGNGAILRFHKKHEATPEHVGFMVNDRRTWKEHIKPFLQDVDRRRISFEQYSRSLDRSRQEQRYFCWRGMGPFELIHPVCGHENLLMGMALDRDWVVDMFDTYATFIINHLEVLFCEAGKPDAIFFSEDLGFKLKPFMSPQMYQEIIMPSHKRLFDFAHMLGCPVLIHSCGYVEPLVPYLIEAGMDCLQAMEVKAEMDMPRLFTMYGDKIAFFGNIDARVLMSNDRRQINEELLAKLPPVLSQGGSYILHSDHSEPPDVDYDTIWYFLRRGREIASQFCGRNI